MDKTSTPASLRFLLVVDSYGDTRTVPLTLDTDDAHADVVATLAGFAAAIGAEVGETFWFSVGRAPDLKTARTLRSREEWAWSLGSDTLRPLPPVSERDGLTPPTV